MGQGHKGTGGKVGKMGKVGVATCEDGLTTNFHEQTRIQRKVEIRVSLFSSSRRIGIFDISLVGIILDPELDVK